MASATIQYSIHDYYSAQSVLKGRDTKKIGNNTYLIRAGEDAIYVRYHRTNIVVYSPGVAVYTDGGWQTYTTKDRLNQLLPNRYTIFQKKHRWYLWDRVSDSTEEWLGGVSLPT